MIQQNHPNIFWDQLCHNVGGRDRMSKKQTKLQSCFFAGRLLSKVQVKTMDSKILWKDLDISTTHWLMQFLNSIFILYTVQIYLHHRLLPQFPRNFTTSSMPRKPSAAPAERRKSCATEEIDGSLCIGPLSARTSVSKPAKWCNNDTSDTPCGIQIQNNQKASGTGGF